MKNKKIWNHLLVIIGSSIVAVMIGMLIYTRKEYILAPIQTIIKFFSLPVAEKENWIMEIGVLSIIAILIFLILRKMRKKWRKDWFI